MLRRYHPAMTTRPARRRSLRSAPALSRGLLALAALGLVAALAGCSGDDDEEGAGEVPDDFRAEQCLVRVHGRSDTGSPPKMVDGHAELAPDANEAFDGGGRVWIYDTEESADAARDQVLEVIDAAECERVVLHGFSNGAAFVAALVCDGESFDGRLVGAVVDDPVTDDSSPDCAPADGVATAVYWTGGLTEGVAGASCEELGWTCAGGDELVGIDEFAERLGAEVQPSPFDEHRPYLEAPELTDWLTAS